MEKRLPWYQQLRRERQLRGWSQSVLAEKIGSDPKTVSRWERKKSFPSPYLIQKLCELFGKNAEELGLINEDDNELKSNDLPTYENLEVPSPSSFGFSSVREDFVISSTESSAERHNLAQQPNSTPQLAAGVSAIRLDTAILPILKREFVGRHAEVAMFTNSLISAQKPILFFHGIGGIGKSWLINWLITFCQNEKTSLVDFSEASHLDFLTIMTTICNQIDRTVFMRFSRDLEKYDFIWQAQSIETLKLFNQHAFLKQPSQAQETSITYYLSMPDVERMRIIRNARESLTASFTSDLLEAVEKRKCILFFDTIERVDPDTGRWLQSEFLPGIVSSQSKNLLLVLSGRKESIWSKLAREWNYFIEERELTNFTLLEVEDYLKNRDLIESSSKVSDLIYKFTAGHPLCVGLAADLLAEYTQYGDKLDEALVKAYKKEVSTEIISDFLTQRILDRLPTETSKLIMLCAITHWFDASIIRQLSIDSEPFHIHSIEHLEAIKSFSFVRPYHKGHRGYTFHEVIRRFLILKWRQDDPDMYRTLNEHALQYFEHELVRADANTRSELIIEKVYHLLAVDETAGMVLLGEMFEQFDKLFKKDICRRLVDVATEHEWNEETNERWIELQRMLG